MKKIALILIVLLALTPLFAEGAKDASGTSEKDEIIVFAAASLTDVMDEIIALYSESHPDVNIVANYDSSGTLRTQIREGAPCDIFISAAQLQMDEMEEEGFVVDGTRVDLLENQVTLAVAEGNKKGIESFDQLAELLKRGDVLLAIGNSDVPVGQYTKLIFDYYGLNEDELNSKGVLTYGSNVREVTTQVSELSVDCGIIYSTDAYSAGLEVVDSATAEMCGQVIYPAALINTGSSATKADFFEFIKGDEARTIFESVGFKRI